jgi:hypothetical protein
MAKTSPERKWHQMTAGEKLVWVGKLVVALATFGFAFPHIMDAHLQEE